MKFPTSSLRSGLTQATDGIVDASDSSRHGDTQTASSRPKAAPVRRFGLPSLGALAVGVALLPAAVLAEPAAAAINPCTVTCGDPGVLFDEGRAAPWLSGRYAGRITGGFGSQARLDFVASGRPEWVSVPFHVSGGLETSCYGQVSFEDRVVRLSGHRSAVGGDGSSRYDLEGWFTSWDVTAHMSVTGATLDANGRTFAGTAVLDIMGPVANCTRSLPFTTQSVA